MLYKDLDPYFLFEEKLDNVKSIGWLGRGTTFSKGECSQQWLDKLSRLIIRDNVNQMRGYHYCDLCSKDEVVLRVNDEFIILGSAEIWVPSADNKIIYAAPNLIYHYITDHFYLPPDEFIDSVADFDFNSEWNARKILS